jgi:hypothetical protein
MEVTDAHAHAHAQVQENEGAKAPGVDKEIWAGYRRIADSMLVATTFAGTVTLTIVLAPRDASTTIPGIKELAYASSFFLGSIMGCILIIVSVEIGKDDDGLWFPMEIWEWVVRIELLVVGCTLLVSFYLLLLASSFFLSYRGPFIISSIFYLGCGFLTIVFTLMSWNQRSLKCVFDWSRRHSKRFKIRK